MAFTLPFMTVQATVLLRRPPGGRELKMKSVTDLINQSEIKYGTLEKGIIVRAFKKTNETILKILYRNMLRFKPSSFTSTNEDGIERVRRDKYAFILPDTIGKYMALKPPCDLVTMDTFLMQKGYGLALPKYSDIYSKINRGVRILRRKNILDSLRRKWWLDRSICNGIKSSKIYSPNLAVKLPARLGLDMLLNCMVAFISARLMISMFSSAD